MRKVQAPVPAAKEQAVLLRAVCQDDHLINQRQSFPVAAWAPMPVYRPGPEIHLIAVNGG